MSTSVETMLYRSSDFDWEEYTASRPIYPKQLYDIIFDYHSKAGGKYFRALDVGCGPGTATQVLAPRFSDEVVGIDVNEKQLENAQKCLSHLEPKVHFKKSAAEDLAFVADHSVDLIACAEAIHWINSAKFVSEAARVLAPNGTLAIWFYYPTVLIPSSAAASSIHYRTMNENFHRVVARSARRAALSEFRDSWRSEADNIAFPVDQWKNETRIRWNRQEDNWYLLDSDHFVERIDKRGLESEGYVEKSIDDLDFMSRSFTPAQFRQYIRSIDIVHDDDWPEMDSALAEIRKFLEPSETIDVSWIAGLIMTTRR
ncbi:S-adenosyl-L-methionine-dependent methyltransferase [Clavulina sp. PMI_390]|nr:S-adenosyl-L-methionine-dependent methyltransferase [Clavulina sp. PMI_390]